MWPTDDEDRGAAEASTPKASGNKPAESTKPADQPKPAASSEPQWPTDDEEIPDEPPAKPAVDEPAAAEVNKPAESPETEDKAPSTPAVNKPAESEIAGQRPVEREPEPPAEPEENKPDGSDDTVRVPAEPPATAELPKAADQEPEEDVEPASDAEAPEEPAAAEVNKPAEPETAGQRPEGNKPAEPEDAGHGPDGIKPAESEGAGQRLEGIEPAESFRWVDEPDPEQTVPTEPEPHPEAQATADLRIPEDRSEDEDRDGEDTQSVAVDEPVGGPEDELDDDDRERTSDREHEREYGHAREPASERDREYEHEHDRGHEADSESTQRVATTGEQPALLRRYVEDTQVIDLRALQSPRRQGPPPPSSPLQRPQQRPQGPQGPQGPQRQGPPRPSGPPPGRVIPPVGPPRARPMRIEPRLPEREPESPAERTEMFHLEPPPRREELQRRDPEPLPPHRELLQRKAAEPEEYDDLYDRLYDEDDEDDDQPAPRRRRKGLLITLLSLVVVLAVAAGVVFTVPGLAGKLGLKGGNDVAIAPPPSPVAFAPQLKGPDPQAPNPTQSGVAQALEGPASAGALGTLTGVVVDPADGTVLWDRNSDTGLTPASTGKILTSAAALLSLDHTTQFVTRVVQGDQPGTVILVGGGDLTLNSLPPGEDSVYPGSAHVDDLIAQVKKATGGKVNKVLIDVHRYSGPLLAPGWDPKDVAAGYQTPMEPVMMDGGRADPTEDEKSTRSPRPARAVATKIADAFGATVPENATATAKANAPVLGEVRSAPLVELIDNLLQISDNMLAEGVLREVAKQNGEEVSYAGGVRAVRKVLQDNGFDVSGYQMVDGSGLSKQDKATAKLLADVLAVAAAPDGKDPRTAKLRPLLGGLPVAGGSGTLNPRFHDAKSKEGKGWVRAKTGTLTGVNTLAGVVLDKDGRVLVFALMSNNGDGLQAPPALDAVAARLRECGCG